MNPDFLEETLTNFLRDNDHNAFESLENSDKKYKIKYQTVFDVKSGPIDV